MMIQRKRKEKLQKNYGRKKRRKKEKKNEVYRTIRRAYMYKIGKKQKQMIKEIMR